jgi:hypothetical protein
MKKIYCIAILLLFSCKGHNSVESDNKQRVDSIVTLGKFPYRSVDEFSIIIIDSCEYIIYNAKANDGGAFAHKGNCKYCVKRNKMFVNGL